MTKILCVSTSLGEASRSRALLRLVHTGLGATDGVEARWLDLAENTMPLCDGRHPLAAYGEPVAKVSLAIEAADALVFGMAVYCYSVSGTLKNLIDLCARAMDSKPFGVVAAAGGQMSYMSVGDLQRILMFECRAYPFPRAIYSSGSDWDKAGARDEGLDEGVVERVEQFVAGFAPFAARFSASSPE
ncbi:NAD(P)H-dependent oxidoreductase [bacterium]|nr:NAD(P)H-dependent oxidoreductase [bacterium]